jgi:hypothetical protein
MEDILNLLDLGFLLTRSYGTSGNPLDATADWAELLSVGEAQRLGFARLLYHEPAVVFMDESTSALDVPLEAKCLGLLRAAGITLVSIAHRPTAIPFHDVILKLTRDDPGAESKYEVIEITEADRRRMEDERKAFEAMDGAGIARSERGTIITGGPERKSMAERSLDLKSNDVGPHPAADTNPAQTPPPVADKNSYRFNALFRQRVKVLFAVRLYLASCARLLHQHWRLTAPLLLDPVRLGSRRGGAVRCCSCTWHWCCRSCTC